MTTSPPRSPLDRAFLQHSDDVGNLILVRHGQQDFPEPGKAPASAWIDPPLSELGRSQATAVGTYLANDRVDAVYSSHLERAHHTGQAIAAHHQVDVRVVEDLAEVYLFNKVPDGENATDHLGEDAIATIRDNFVRTRRWDAYPLSEPSIEFRQRAVSAIDRILAQHNGHNVVIACHGGVINIYLSHYLGLSEDMFFRPAHASIHRIRFLGAERVIESLNEDRFLRDASLHSH